MARILLSIVGLAYLALAAWCIAKPATTAASVGFDLRPGGGQSEYLAVYGGLQIGLGLMFLWPWLRPEDTTLVLGACLLVHASIVVCRAIGFVLFSGIETTTYALAVVEWAIVLACGWAFWQR